MNDASHHVIPRLIHMITIWGALVAELTLDENRLDEDGSLTATQTWNLASLSLLNRVAIRPSCGTSTGCPSVDQGD